MSDIPFERGDAPDAPLVEELRYVRPDGTVYRAQITKSIMGGWLAQIWDDQGRRVWVNPRPWKSRAGLIRRCTEEIDREARRRAA